MAPGEWRLDWRLTCALGVLLACAGLTLLSVGLVSAEDRHALMQLTVDHGQDVRAVWSPDGSRIAFQSDREGRYQIWTMDPDGGTPVDLSQDESDDRHPVWSPDGRRIAFDSGDSVLRDIWVMNTDGSDRHRVTTIDGFNSFPSWSADGSRLAFYNYRDGVTDLWLIGADGSAPNQVTRGLADERKNNCTNSCHRPSWSPDDRQIALSGGDHRSVWTVDVSTGAMHQITDGVLHTHFPFFMRDGRLAYVVEYIQQGAAYTDLMVTDPATPGSSEPLLSNVSIQGPYELSPDGQRVLFHSPRAGNFDIYVADTGAQGGMVALQSPRADADISPAVPTPAPRAEPAPTPAPHLANAPAVGVAPAAAAPAAVPAAVAAVVPDSPATPWLPMAIAVLAVFGGTALIITGLQVARRRR
jgi:Tol biopolymer transport system component